MNHHATPERNPEAGRPCNPPPASADLEDRTYCFRKLDDFELVLCTTCGICVWPESIAQHLKGPNHKDLERGQAIRLQTAVKARWPHLWALRTAPSPPQALDFPVPGLPLRSDGVGCPSCQLVAQTEREIIKHYREHHRLAERDDIIDPVDPQHNILYHAFFLGNRHSTWGLPIRVLHEAIASANDPTTIARERVEQIEAGRIIRDLFEARMQAISARDRTIPDTVANQPNPLAAIARWPILFQGHLRDRITSLTSPPRKGSSEVRFERAALMISSALLSTVAKCHIRLEANLPRQLKAILVMTSINPDPGVAQMRMVSKQTVKVYTKMLIRAVMFILRLYFRREIGPVEVDDSDLTIITKTPQCNPDAANRRFHTVKFTREQHAAISEVFRNAGVPGYSAGAFDSDVQIRPRDGLDDGSDGDDDDDDNTQYSYCLGEDDDDGNSIDGYGSDGDYAISDDPVQVMRRSTTATGRPSEVERGQLDELEGACEKLLISFFCHRTDGEEFESALVVGLSALSITNRGYTPSPVYTRFLSAAIYIGRVMLLRQSDNLVSSAQGTSLAETLTNMLEQYGPGKLGSPLSWARGVRAFGCKLNLSAGNEGSVYFDDGRVNINGIGVHISDLRSGVQALCDQAEKTLREKLLFLPSTAAESDGGNGSGEAPHRTTSEIINYEDIDPKDDADIAKRTEVDFGGVFDNASLDRVGKGIEGPLREAGHQIDITVIGSQVTGSNELRARFFDRVGDHEPRLNVANAIAYIDTVDSFLEDILVLAHLTAGQPARGTELLSLRHSTVHHGGPRGLMFYRGHLISVTTYSKVANTQGDIKPIVRVFPDRVGKLIARYLVFVLPFVEALAQDVRVRERSRSEIQPSSYIWPAEGLPCIGKPWTSRRLSKALEKFFVYASGTRHIGVRLYRHIAIAFCRHLIGGHSGELLVDNATAPSRQRPDQATSNARTSFCGSSLYNADASPADGSRSATELSRVRDLQAGHGTSVAVRFYAVGLGHLIGEGGLPTRDAYCLVSADWHDLLGFPVRSAKRQERGGGVYNDDQMGGPGIKGVLSAVGRRISPRTDDQSRAITRAANMIGGVGDSRVHTAGNQASRRQRLAGIDLHGELRDLLGDGASFRGEQLPALRAIIARTRHITVVMPTGHGKSILFLLPAHSGLGGTTIVVVPTISLRRDIYRRCVHHSISAAEWNSTNPPMHGTSIIVVTYAAFGEPTFRGYLDRLRAQHLLDRIFFDECHTLLDDWREIKDGLANLAGLDAQLICMSATLPPCNEQTVWYRLGVPRVGDCTYRQTTLRPNIRYSVELLAHSTTIPDLIARAYDLVNEYLKSSVTGNDTVIVYCRNRSTVRQLGTLLDCPQYYSDAPDLDQALDRIHSGSTRVIVATNALAMGIDIGRVGYVLHIGAPSQLADYAQESGRAGRSGDASFARILTCEVVDFPKERDPRMALYLQPAPTLAPCRRVVLDLMDDTKVLRTRCDDIRMIPCDLCRPEYDVSLYTPHNPGSVVHVGGRLVQTHAQPTPSGMPEKQLALHDIETPVRPRQRDTTSASRRESSRAALTLMLDKAREIDDVTSTQRERDEARRDARFATVCLDLLNYTPDAVRAARLAKSVIAGESNGGVDPDGPFDIVEATRPEDQVDPYERPPHRDRSGPASPDIEPAMSRAAKEQPRRPLPAQSWRTTGFVPASSLGTNLHSTSSNIVRAPQVPVRRLPLSSSASKSSRDGPCPHYQKASTPDGPSCVPASSIQSTQYGSSPFTISDGQVQSSSRKRGSSPSEPSSSRKRSDNRQMPSEAREQEITRFIHNVTTARMRETQDLASDVDLAFGVMRTRCIVCDSNSHLTAECASAAATALTEKTKKGGKLRFASYTACYLCGNPQSICPSRGRSCKAEHILTSFFVMRELPMVESLFQERILQVLGPDATDSDIFKHLGSEAKDFGTYDKKLHWLALHMVAMLHEFFRAKHAKVL